MSRRHAAVCVASLLVALALPARAAVELAALDTPGNVKDVAFDGAIVYSAAATGGVRVVDVSNPAAPTEIASLPPVPLGNVQALFLDGDRLYTAEGTGGVGVIDVANPALPTRLGRATGMNQILDVVAGGDYAYAISDVGPLSFHVIDVSAPATPVVVASIAASGSSVRWHSAQRVLAGTNLVDVSNPLAPQIVAYDFAYPNAIGDGFGISTALRRYDLADPQSPVLVNDYLGSDGVGTSVALDAELVWLLRSSSGLGLFEVSDAQPTYPQIAAISLPGLLVQRVRAVGARLYVATAGAGATGLYVFDVSNPAAPTQLGHFAASDLDDVDVAGDVAWAVDRVSFDDGVAGLYAIDVSDPSAMHEIAFVPFEGGDLVSVAGSRVNVVDADIVGPSVTLRVFDGSDPSSPDEIAALPVSGVVNELASSGTRLYTTGSHDFRIYDAATPGVITQLGQYASAGITSGLAVAGTRAFVTSDRLEVIDFAIPFAPALVSSFDLPGTVSDFADPVVVGSRVHVQARRPQLLTIDASDPTALRVAGTSLVQTSGSLLSGTATASGDALFFGWNAQIVVYDTAGTSGIGARSVASFPSVTGNAIALDAARDLAFVADGVLRVLDVAPDRALAECANGRDDDGDGLVDHFDDPECRDGHDRSERADCGNGVDDDGDGAVDFPADASCASASEASEGPSCEDGLDDDGDGAIDFGADPGCKGRTSDLEAPKCQNGIDDDGDGAIDFDGGASLHGGVALGPRDPNCNQAWRNHEAPGSLCGLGAELALAFALLRRARRRAAPRSTARSAVLSVS